MNKVVDIKTAIDKIPGVEIRSCWGFYEFRGPLHLLYELAKRPPGQ